MQSPLVTPLPGLGVLRVAGPDARKFLQGQLSNDVERLDRTPGLRAGLHTPQGRVIAILQLFPCGEAVLAVLPRELAGTVATHLSRHVLRAKVRIEDASEAFAVFGLDDGDSRQLVVLPSGASPEGDRGFAG